MQHNVFPETRECKSSENEPDVRTLWVVTVPSIWGRFLSAWHFCWAQHASISSVIECHKVFSSAKDTNVCIISALCSFEQYCCLKFFLSSTLFCLLWFVALGKHAIFLVYGLKVKSTYSFCSYRFGALKLFSFQITYSNWSTSTFKVIKSTSNIWPSFPMPTEGLSWSSYILFHHYFNEQNRFNRISFS